MVDVVLHFEHKVNPAGYCVDIYNRDDYWFDRITLDTSDLQKLERLLRDGISQQYNFSLSTRHEHRNISAGNVTELFEHTELPSILTELHIHVWDHDPARSIVVDFSALVNHLRVEGEDEVWVEGKYKQLSEWLKTKRRKFPSLRYWFANKWIASALLGSVAALLTRFAPVINPYLYLLSWISVLYLLRLSISLSFLPGGQRAKIILRPEPRRLSDPNVREILTITIAVLSLVATVIQTVLAWIQ